MRVGLHRLYDMATKARAAAFQDAVQRRSPPSLVLPGPSWADADQRGLGQIGLASGVDAARLGRIIPERMCEMDKDRVIGTAKMAKGKIKEATGKVLGDSKLQAEGKVDRIEGALQNAVGGIKDAMRGE